MNAATILPVAICLTLLGVAALTVIDLIRYRDRARFDIALMFAALGSIILLGQLALVTGWKSPVLAILAFSLMLAHPYLLLRLVMHFYPVPRWIRWSASATLVLSSLAMMLFKQWTVPSRMILISLFVAVEGYAAYAFLKEVRTIRGAKRWKSALAGTGALLITALMLFAGLNLMLRIPNQTVAPYSQSVLLAASICYLLGFAPPAWIRNAWQLFELRRFLLRMSGSAPAEQVNVALDQLCLTAREAVGGVAAVAAGWDEADACFRVRAATRASLLDGTIRLDHELFRQAWERRHPVFVTGPLGGDSDIERQAHEVGAQALLATPVVTADWSWGVLVVFLRSGALFVEDDLALISLMAETSARTVEMQELLAREKTVAESAPYALIVVEQNGKICRVNARAEEFFGYAREEIHGSPINLLLPDMPAEAVQYQGRRRDGGLFPAGIRSSAMQLEGRAVTMFTVEDVTAREQADREIALRTAQLEAANRELEAFSYSVSHDLRAPLRAIDGFSRILEEDYGEELSAEARRYIDLVRGSTRRMAALIDDLLAFARLGRQSLRKTTVDAGLLARTTFDELQSVGEGKPVSLAMGKLPECQADPALLRQVLVNLLSNAIKFSRHCEEPRVEIGYQSDTGSPAYFVKDNGVGFDMAYSHKLFGVFQRLHSQEEYEGTGVGLAIVQRILDRHGGRIWADSELGRGSTFYFTLAGGS